MRAPRSVTLHPMGTFSRSLKFAIDFLARVMTGFWPVMACRSAVAKSRILGFSLPSPTPMLMTIFSRRGTWKGLVYPRSFMRAGMTAVLNRSRRRGGTSPVTRARVATGAAAGAAAAPPLPPRGLAPGAGLPPWEALPPCGGFGLLALLSSAMAYALSMISPDRRAIRAFLPSASWRTPTRVGLLVCGSTSITLDRWIAPSRSMMPPWRSFCVGRWCFLIMLIFSTTTRPLPGTTRRTFPRLPRSLPATTTTVSPFRTCAMAMAVSSDDFRSKRDNLRELAVAQLARHGAEDARAHGVVVRLEEDDGVAVEAYVGAVLAADLLHRAHDHCPGHLALLHRPVRHRLLDGDDHDVAQGGVALVGAAQDADALRLLGARVVRDVEHASRLDHGALSVFLTTPGSGPDGCATASLSTTVGSPRSAPGHRPWSRSSRRGP